MTLPSVRTAARVRLTGISKRYPGTLALDDVDLDIRPGEIQALIGGNGSGKSTLIKVLCGVEPAEPGGTIDIGGSETGTETWSADAARSAGVHVVHQDLGVFLDLTVAENLAIGEGFAKNRMRGVSWPDVLCRASTLIDRFMIDATPQTPMRSLNQANRTLVAIARAVQDGAHDRGLLILDEPTAALSLEESDVLLSTLERFAAAGQSILYVSHRLDEIMRIAHRVTALRDGRSAGTSDVVELDEASLVRLIVGSDLPRPVESSRAHLADEPVLELHGVSVGPLEGIDLDVRPGEIVGVAGLVGSGRSTLLRAVFGAHPFRDGSMSLNGRRQRLSSCHQAIAAGVAYVPEDRAHDAAFRDLSVASNIAMPALQEYRSLAGMQDRALRSAARRLMDAFLVKARSPETPMATLSGGNQQKVVLARWLGMEPQLLLLDEPTQGVDVGARAEIHAMIRRAADQGMAVLMVASDPEELALTVDRAVVLRGGRIATRLDHAEVTADRLITEIHSGRSASV
jgi:ribose transport system ATP-binding protein